MRIVVIEDHQMFRDVLRKVCEADLRHCVVGETGDGKQALELIRSTRPDLALLDLQLTGLHGFDVIEAVRKLRLRTRFLVLSSHCDQFTVYRIECAGVHGFVDKNTNTVAVLRSAINAIARGGTYFSCAFEIIRRNRMTDPHSFDKLLTERERTVLCLIARALTDAEVAAQLGISIETVEKHRQNIRQKFGIHSAPELMRFARDHGFAFDLP